MSGLGRFGFLDALGLGPAPWVHTAGCPCGASLTTDNAELAKKFVELHAAHNIPTAFTETRRIKLRCPKCEEEILALVHPKEPPPKTPTA